MQGSTVLRDDPPSRSSARAQSGEVAQRFDEAVYLIAAGLVEKELLYEEDPDSYPYSATFRHGLAMLAALSVECCQNPASFLSGLSETSFIRGYASKEVRQWVCGWSDEALGKLSRSKYLELGPLAVVDGGYFCPTRECHEVLRLAEGDLIGGYQERKVYEYLRESSQELYVLGRLLLVEHPILTWDECMDIKTGRFDFSTNPLCQGEDRFAEPGWLKGLLDLAYEEAPANAKVCPNCGWTMSLHGRQPYCITPDCIKELPSDFAGLPDVEHDAFRLLRGVMHYICAPGRLEVAVANKARGLGLAYELWPEKDTADVLITGPDGRRLAVDAKAYGSAERLAQEIRDDAGISRLEADEVVYVVPNEVQRQQPGFCFACNEVLRGKRGYSCCTLRELSRRLRDMAGGGR